MTRFTVANGHYSKPSYGGFGTESEIKERFQGKVLHSHNYRSPELSGFKKGQKVVIIGASASALDISVELSRYVIVVKIIRLGNVNQISVCLKSKENIVDILFTIS